MRARQHAFALNAGQATRALSDCPQCRPSAKWTPTVARRTCLNPTGSSILKRRPRSYHRTTSGTARTCRASIHDLHALVGNAVTDGKEIVVGIGSTELISASMYALSQSTATHTQAAVWTAKPFYSGYVEPADFYHTRDFGWHASDEPPTADAARPVIELITSPNNPDGYLRSPRVLPSPYRRVMMDHAYLWPHFTPITSPVSYGNDTVALFTLSKMTGHASTRIGWAVVSDPAVAARMRKYVGTTTFGSPRENQLRAIAALEHVIATRGRIFTHARTLMLGRWRRLERIFSAQAAPPLFRLQNRSAAGHDTFSGEDDYEPSPAYAWVELTSAGRFGGDAMSAMASVGILARPGSLFGADRAHARLQLLMREQTFDILCEKLGALVGNASRPQAVTVDCGGGNCTLDADGTAGGSGRRR